MTKKDELAALLVEFDEKLGDLQDVCIRISDATGFDGLSEYTDRVKDRVYEAIRLASEPEGGE